MDREQAFRILKQNIQNSNLIKHCLAVEAVMRALAEHFQEDEEKWALAGLLHDIDYERTKDSLMDHSAIGAAMLKDLGFEEDICEAVKTHNEAHGIVPETKMAKALFVSDPITGLIVAAALILPAKKISDLTTDSILNRFKEKAFARSVKREIIQKCEDYLGLSLADFTGICLGAMQKISADLGL